MLNFGHSFGHGLESFLLENGNAEGGHGLAVAAGMIVESYLSQKRLGLPLEQMNQINNKIKGFIHFLSFLFKILTLYMAL